MNDSFGIRKRSKPLQQKGRGTGNGFFRELEMDIVEHVEFFQAFIREPASVGALSPSSKALAEAMVHGCALDKADMVVELGAGTGAFTGLIRRQMRSEATFMAIELDPIHARRLRRRFPGVVVYNDTAENLAECLAMHGKAKADYIISGLPWANISPREQDRIMEAILSCLAPSGLFTTFTYLHARWLPKARQFRGALKQNFASTNISPIVWRNFPPALVYRCQARA
jgi:phosphatidylethanolamine/phosphatidyl-N-methylethanolamine N-methyltransferase